MDTLPSSQSTPVVKPPKVTVTKQPWDWHHAGILVLFGFGVVRGALPMFILAAHGGGTLNGGQLLTSIGALALSAVFAFLKTPPGTLLAALEEGETVGEGKSP
jgi:hypothetical protein